MNVSVWMQHRKNTEISLTKYFILFRKTSAHYQTANIEKQLVEKRQTKTKRNFIPYPLE